jgi:hypothetical protein
MGDPVDVEILQGPLSATMSTVGAPALWPATRPAGAAGEPVPAGIAVIDFKEVAALHPLCSRPRHYGISAEAAKLMPMSAVCWRQWLNSRRSNATGWLGREWISDTACLSAGLHRNSHHTAVLMARFLRGYA